LNVTGPIIMPDITPPPTPASSPLDIGIWPLSTITNLLLIITVNAQVGGSAWLAIAMFGNGVGIGGNGGAGTRQTSGMAMQFPMAVVHAGPGMAVS
jgi:hypothetical protein